jgi:hypothetical protein
MGTDGIIIITVAWCLFSLNLLMCLQYPGTFVTKRSSIDLLTTPSLSTFLPLRFCPCLSTEKIFVQLYIREFNWNQNFSST